ncbi:heavy-metal-associated domain-containing protein [Scatolibacter rhodanostii]|uniref:heavy-metal-associated domain-containing protein n=1 Tax=Scatolibacter rhodanostii TaxID=2014781 RepID=UPI000C085BE0|nr:heavy-metal-associated domain-containing protein [Scatolibacter rhodanostii]
MGFRLFAKKNQETVTIGISGMSCEHCVKRMREALLENDAVKKADVSLDNGGSATIVYHADKTDVAALKKIITETGYTPAD